MADALHLVKLIKTASLSPNDVTLADAALAALREVGVLITDDGGEYVDVDRNKSYQKTIRCFLAGVTAGKRAARGAGHEPQV